MGRTSRKKSVLAIGIDAGEPAFVRGLIEAGELPTLKRLLDEGAWSRVVSPATIGSGAVWPTFFTGREPAEHGVHSYWRWRPETMTLTRHDADSLTPFWKSLDERGLTVGMLDVPFAPRVGLSRGFEIIEWGPHDAIGGRMRFGPESLSDLLTKETQPHPFSINREEGGAPFELEGLRRLSAACFEGATLRGELSVRLLSETQPDLSIIIFTELHHAVHRLWHTVAPEHALYAREEIRRVTRIEPGIADILREIDRQVGRLIETAGDGASVLVFSLHGIRPARGLPAFLEPLMRATGNACLRGWAGQSWTERALSLFAAAKRRVPARLKKIYYRSLSPDFTGRLAQPTMIPAYDWEQTRAFALPSDQHGWIRINLMGREAKGSVPLESYYETCDEIEEMLRTLATEDGRPLVRDVLRAAEVDAGPPGRGVPDLVVHWHDAAFEMPIKWDGLLLEAHPAAVDQTGQHAPEGFMIMKGHKANGDGVVRATEIQRLITEALDVD
jgi:predicted AlkP superfamily phosphohydrolase/phosphomutase